MFEFTNAPRIHPAEYGSLLAAGPLGAATATRELDAYGNVDADWIQQVPGAEHMSSMLGGYLVGMAGAIGSMACQIALETSRRGVGDKWDVITGVIATIPGMIGGRALPHIFRATK